MPAREPSPPRRGSRGRAIRGEPGRAAARPVVRTPTRLFAAILSAGLLAGCASGGTPAAKGGLASGPGPPGSGAECPLEPGPGPRDDTLTVSAPGSVEPRDVPSPRSAAERMAFRQMYRTLLRVDCAGRLLPGVADRWSSADGGRRWTFHIRGTARFWDGTQVAAGDVAWSWRRLAETRAASGFGKPSRSEGAPGGDASGAYGGAPARVPEPRGPAIGPPALPDSIAAPDAATLELFYDHDRPEASAFADPRLAVLRAGPGAWPLGSGPLRPAPGLSPDGDSLVLAPAFGRGPTVILLESRQGPGADERDLLDAGVDVVVDADPAARRYAESLPDYVTLPVPGDRTYVLVVARADSGPPAGLAQLRVSLARDAVRGGAVPAGPLAWRFGTSCAQAAAVPAARAGPPEAGRLAYAVGDGSARDLADRIVALASAPSGGGPLAEAVASLLGPAPSGGWRTLPLEPGVASLSARAGLEAAYILALPRRVLDPCAARGALHSDLPWLGDRRSLVPLVDVRPVVLVKRDVAGLAVDFDGTLRLDEAGRRAARTRP